jgi:hypothetical protein
MTFLELAKAALPGASNEDADYVLWNHTAFPFETSPRALYRSLSSYRRAAANGRRLCTTCNNIAVDEWSCARCNRLIVESV